ncbi:hypothetical protein [Aeromicrobium terrae]|uniref:hypothetical protein n=1 Tax=Aeromicrobium terrae TaxID=2498846 RepID=UPI001E2856E6|nr:hypothetical protein [Aeromicrobium terrae]
MEVRRSSALGRALIAAAAGIALVVAAMVVPRISDRDVRVHWPPLHADWDPRFGWRFVVAILVGVALWYLLPRLTDRLSWGATVAVSTAGAWVWAMSLALTDGRYGLARIYEREGEYLFDAKRVDDVGQALSTFIDRIPRGSEDHWHIHVSGHPPGALLSFVLLDRIGIDDPFWVGVVILTLGTTAVAAVLLTLDVLGSRELARKAAPWVALAPLAVWAGAGESLYAAVAAWGLLLLAGACRHSLPAVAIAAGLVLGFCLFLSYGLVLFGLLALAVLALTGGWRMLPWAAAGVATVAVLFWSLGYAWWEAYPVLRERYYAGIASERPYSYWVWADLAAWTFTVGLATWAAFPQLARSLRDRIPLAVLASTALTAIVAASLSAMSKAEVERIWLPFTVWVVAAPALLPVRWRAPLLSTQVGVALFSQIFLVTRW